MVSTRLSEPEGGRRKPGRLSIGLRSGVLSAMLVMGLGGLGGGIRVAWVEGQAWYLAAVVVVAGIAGA